MLFYVLFVRKCVLYYCCWVSTQLHVTNISIQNMLNTKSDTQLALLHSGILCSYVCR